MSSAVQTTTSHILPPAPAASSSQLMVHTPYSCEHDLVPSDSLAASSVRSPNNTNSNNTNGGVPSTAATAAAVTGDGFPQSTGSGFDFYNPCPASVGASSTTGGNDSFCGGMQRTTSYESLQQHQHQQQMMTCSTNSRRSMSHSSDSSQSGHSNVAYNMSSTTGYNSSSATGPQTPGGSCGNYPNYTPRAPIVNTPVHAAHLQGKAEFLDFPQTGAEITTAAQWNRQHKVFIGHVKFELSADGLRWLIYMLTGVQAGKVEVRGMGCFMVFFGSSEEVFRVRGLHKRVLFDTTGIWFAQDQQQEQTLHNYAQNVAPSVHAKLPKGLMVVDEETSRRRPRKGQSKSANNANCAASSAIAPTQAAAAASTPSGHHCSMQQGQNNFSPQNNQPYCYYGAAAAEGQSFNQHYATCPNNSHHANGGGYMTANQLWDQQC